MGIRHEGRIHLTIGCAFVGRFVSGLNEYVNKKETARAIAIAARAVTTLDIEATINAGDNLDKGDVFLTVTGTSAEAGDDGEAGRGNRVSGLITPYRVMTIEAAAGKNPVSHIGKLYNLLAARIASALTAEMRSVEDAACVIVSQIGCPVHDPQLVDIRLTAGDAPLSTVLAAEVKDVVHSQLGLINILQNELLSEQVTLY